MPIDGQVPLSCSRTSVIPGTDRKESVAMTTMTTTTSTKIKHWQKWMSSRNLIGAMISGNEKGDRLTDSCQTEGLPRILEESGRERERERVSIKWLSLLNEVEAYSSKELLTAGDKRKHPPEAFNWNRHKTSNSCFSKPAWRQGLHNPWWLS